MPMNTICPWCGAQSTRDCELRETYGDICLWNETIDQEDEPSDTMLLGEVEEYE